MEHAHTRTGVMIKVYASCARSHARTDSMAMRYCAVPAQMLPSMHAATGPKCLATAIAIGILVSVGRGGVALTWRVGSYESSF